MARGHKPRHSGSPIRHSGASRNLWRVAICTVNPAPSIVIPAPAGIYGVWPYAPSIRLPQPSFRRKPESMVCGHMHRHSGLRRNLWRAVIRPVIPAQAGIYGAWPYAPSFRRKPESMARGHTPRHSGAGWNLWRAAICPVIPAQAGIYGVRSYAPSFRLPQPSFRRKPESRACGHQHRHSGASRNLWRVVISTVIPAPPAVIPAKAGIYACRLHYNNRRLRRWIPAQAGTTKKSRHLIWKRRHSSQVNSIISGSVVQWPHYDWPR